MEGRGLEGPDLTFAVKRIPGRRMDCRGQRGEGVAVMSDDRRRWPWPWEGEVKREPRHGCSYSFFPRGKPREGQRFMKVPRGEWPGRSQTEVSWVAAQAPPQG